MAAHKAEQVMAAIQAAVTGLVTTGQNVDRGRAENIPEAQTPALRIRMGADQTDDPWLPSLIDSTLEVIVAAKAIDLAANIETTLNQIRKEVSVALMANQTLGLAFVHAIVEIGASQPSISGDATKPAASVDFTYQVRYRRSRTDPSA